MTLRSVLAVLTTLLLACPLQAQSPPTDAPPSDTTHEDASDPTTRPFRPARFALVTGTLTLANVGLYFWEKNRWWRKKYQTPFHVDDDWRYAKGLDKIAHLYVTDVQAFAYARSLRWSGLSPWTATLTGASLALLVQTHVEYQDGFNRRWGFDRYDIAANMLGAAWFVAHEHVDFLQQFNIRLGYFPSREWREGLDDREVMFADDYAGHTYWLSASVWDWLPSSAQPYWPRWLCLSLGTSLNDWTHDQPYSGYRSYYLSLDLDVAQLLPRSTWLGRTIGDLLNRLHLPFPAIRLYPRPMVHPIFYGQ